MRRELEPRGGYSFVDTSQRVGVKHPASGTALRVISSNARKAFGIVGCPLLVGDEPGAWDVIGGELMHDAIQTAQGKPGSPMRVLYVGTLAPSSGGWWHELVNRGSRGSVHVTALQGDADRWDQWPAIRRGKPAHGDIWAVPAQAARRTERGARGRTAQGSVSVVSAECAEP